MTDLGSAQIAFRLAVAVFVIVTPTLAFLASYRLLERMRDDDLVNRLLDDEEYRPPTADDYIARLTGGRSVPAEGRLTRCRSCGNPTLPTGNCHYCRSDET
jgi:hypothetical protein